MDKIIEKALNNKELRYKISNAEKVVNWRVRVKLKLIEYKGGKCINCGYDKIQYPSVFHFHHRNPEEKEFRIGGTTLAFEKLKEESDKCDLLCANCHAEHHDKDYVKTREESINKFSKRKKELEEALKERLNKKCLYCFCLYDAKRKNQKFCSEKCSIKNSYGKNRKVDRPPKEELEKMLQEKSFCAIGREFGVSDNAIRKWAKKYNLIS